MFDIPTLSNILGLQQALNMVRLPPRVSGSYQPVFDDEQGFSLSLGIDLHTKDADDPKKDFVLECSQELEWTLALTNPTNLAVWISDSLKILYQHEVDEWITVDGIHLKEPTHG